MYRSVSPKSTDNRSMHGGIVIGSLDSRLIGEGNVIELCSWERHYFVYQYDTCIGFFHTGNPRQVHSKKNFDGCVTIAS